MSRFEQAIARIDAVNAEDPNQITVDGEPVAKELAYSRRMSARLELLHPDASDELKLAVRAQHIARWKSPRSDYPEGRAGYKRWRAELLGVHAQLASGIMRDVGYDDATAERVATLIKKTRRATDPEGQALEDVACLVFLEHYFDEFADGRDDDGLIVIIRKTWKKMSEAAHAQALELPLSARAKDLVGRALAG